jgi:pteridine reductase
MTLAGAGMHVGVHYNTSRAEADDTCRSIQLAGGSATLFQADLMERSACRKLIDDVLQTFGRLDVLIPSAASFERITYDALDDAAWDRSLDLNLASQFALAQRATQALRNSQGSIVFLTCTSATRPMRNYLPYVVSKGALRQLMRTLALELAPHVRVNAVAPGTVLPPENMSESDVTRLASRIPLGRIGTPEDIAESVLFLVRSPFVTGHEIIVDGGRTLG